MMRDSAALNATPAAGNWLDGNQVPRPIRDDAYAVTHSRCDEIATYRTRNQPQTRPLERHHGLHERELLAR
jgi:hypothetical protein